MSDWKNFPLRRTRVTELIVLSVQEWLNELSSQYKSDWINYPLSKRVTELIFFHTQVTEWIIFSTQVTDWIILSVNKWLN